MVTLPVLKSLVRSISRKSESNHPPMCNYEQAQNDTTLRDLLTRLAQSLDVDIAATIRTDKSQNRASVLACSRSGFSCTLGVPKLEGGPIAKLIREGRARVGRSKIFTRDEIFPHDATWCDFLPMDTSVSYCFQPLHALPLSSDIRLASDDLSCLFIIIANEREISEDLAAAIGTAAGAALLLHLLARHSQYLACLVGSLCDFLERENYRVSFEEMTSNEDEEFIVPSHPSIESLRIGRLVLMPNPGVKPQQKTDEDGQSQLTYSIKYGNQGTVVTIGRGYPPLSRRKERLDLLRRLTSTIAHEIKNPLTGIAAGIQYLSRKIPAGTTEKETIDFILNEINRLNRIVDDLHAVAKPPRLVFRQTDVNDLLNKSLLCMSELMLRKNISVDLRLTQGLTKVTADADRLQQVFINIIKNAVEATKNDGKIIVETNEDSSGVRISITDQGPGIPPQEREKIFDPFYSTKKGGTGLGLYVSQWIIEQHKGEILVEDGTSGGTRFTIILPPQGDTNGKGANS